MKEYIAYARAIREELHKIPEIGFDLPKTIAVVHRELDKMGLSYTDKWGRSSVVGYINPEITNFTIGLRADMDALPIQEENDVPYKSTHDGIMHACGHDSHTAILLAVLKYMTDHKDQLKCRIKFLFTPAEEYITPGCKALAENGVMDDIDCALAVHTKPDDEVGYLTMTDEPIGSNSMGFKIRFYGLASHAAEQQKGKDAILMAVQAITAMEMMVAKELKVNDSRLLNIGSIHGGNTNNVVCDFVEVFGSCRAPEDEISEFMERRIQEICQGVALTTGGKIEYEQVKFLPYRINNPVVYKKAHETACRQLGAEYVHLPKRRGLGGEDFGYLTRKKPCLFTFFGTKTRGVAKVPPVHNSHFDIDPECYEAPIKFLIGFVMDHMDGFEL